MITNKYMQRILNLFTILFALFLFGTIGYMVVEGWSFLDAFYMSVITVGSVGYGEVQPLSDTGRIFTILYICLGVGTLGFVLSRLIESLLDEGLRGELKVRRMNKQISKMKEHVIVCGYGRVGCNALDVLRQENREVVVVDNSAEKVAQAHADGWVAIEGDATTDEVLERAGVKRAWGLIASAENDSLNLYIVLSARSLNKDLSIVARAANTESEEKMMRVGADRVISPYRIGGQRMAQSLLHPQLTEFLDVLRLDNGIEVWLEEVFLPSDSPLVGQTIAEASIRATTGVTLLAVVNGTAVETPNATTVLNANDNIIVIGTREQHRKLERLMTGKDKVTK